jgi:hypothetical protein
MVVTGKAQMVQLGTARHGVAKQARLRAAWLGLARFGAAKQARRCWAGPGTA